MSIYKVMISYTDEDGNMRYHVVRNIIANSMVGALTFAMNDFFHACGGGETKKVVVELQQLTGESDGKQELIWEFRQIIFKLINDMLNEGNSDIDIAKSLRIDIKLIDEIVEYYRIAGKQNEHIKELESKLAAYYGGGL